MEREENGYRYIPAKNNNNNNNIYSTYIRGQSVNEQTHKPFGSNERKTNIQFLHMFV